jgi:hypothetical protein
VAGGLLVIVGIAAAGTRLAERDCEHPNTEGVDDD